MDAYSTPSSRWLTYSLVGCGRSHPYRRAIGRTSLRGYLARCPVRQGCRLFESGLAPGAPDATVLQEPSSGNLAVFPIEAVHDHPAPIWHAACTRLRL